MGEVILTMKGIDKSFPGVHALDHVDLEVRKGDSLQVFVELTAPENRQLEPQQLEDHLLFQL